MLRRIRTVERSEPALAADPGIAPLSGAVAADGKRRGRLNAVEGWRRKGMAGGTSKRQTDHRRRLSQRIGEISEVSENPTLSTVPTFPQLRSGSSAAIRYCS